MGDHPLTDGFRHEALFYSDPDAFLEGTGTFIEEGLESGDPTLVVLSAEKVAALRSRLGERAKRVQFADMAEVGANPARIIPAWHAFVGEHSQPDVRLRGIGEPIWAERSPAELVECQRHESLLNLAFAGADDFYLLCPYDTSALPGAVLEEARRSHPFLASNDGRWMSEDCRSLEDVAAPYPEPLPEPRSRPEWRVFQAGTLGLLRRLVAARARGADLAERAVHDLVLATHEVCSNSIVHGGGGGILRIWREHDSLICEVQDRGRIDKPLAGRELPRPDQYGGHGLWLANRLCDLVQVRTFAGGSVVRLHKRV